MVGVSVSQWRKIDAQMGAKPYSKRGINMKYEEFMEITEYWSDNDTVCFLMEYDFWNEAVMRFIMHKWRNGLVEAEHIGWYANEHGIMNYTKLPEEDE